MKKMSPKPRNQIRTAWSTYRYLDSPTLRDEFLKDFREILQQKLIKYIDADGKEKYKCGKDHDPRNPDWEPWRYFERFYIQQGLDDFATREYLESMWGRKIICECEFLIDSIEERKEALKRQFGVDFESGKIPDELMITAGEY